MKLRTCLPLGCLIIACLSSNAQTYDQEDLFPLTPGSFWVYDNGHVAYIHNATDNFGTLSVTFSNRTSKGVHAPGFMTLNADSAEVRGTGYGNPWHILVDGDMGYYPFLQRPASLGRTWQTQWRSNGYPTPQTIQVTSTNATVTIQGVAYENCTEVTSLTSYPSGYTPGQVKWVNSRYYFYPSVGCIKRVLTSDTGTQDVIQAIAWDVMGFNSQPCVITQQPESRMVVAGTSARFSARATGPGPLRYQWYKNSAKLAGSTRVTGTTSTNLTINRAGLPDVGDYFVVVTNSYGSVTSAVVSLSLAPGPEKTPPTLDISSHSEMQLVSAATIALSGAASDANLGGSGISWVKVNGVRASGDTASGDGIANWTRTTTLVQGVNTLKIVAADGSGNQVTNLLHINLDSVRPLLVVTSPFVRQRVTNAVITARGRASDKNLESVWCSLNNEPWFQPIGTTNWTATPLELVPGTNVFRAFAMDRTGRSSRTNTVKFTYVVYAPLAVGISAGGTASPNYNGKWLQVGKRYSMTALPTTGFRLESWTDGNGSMLTNRPSLLFVMSSNLTLHANFTDAARPVLAITSPSSSARVTSGSLTVKGGARDNASVAAVYGRLNDDEWKLAVGTTQWTLECDLDPGPNTISAFAVDDTGNRSRTNTISVVFLKDLVQTYWPMHNGDYKTFSGPAGEVTMSFSGDYNTYTMVLNIDGEEFRAYYAYGSDNQSLMLTGGRYGWTGYGFDPDIVELTESQLASGGTRTTSTAITVSGQRISATVKATVSAAGTITVPVGSFKDCKRVAVNVTATYQGRTGTFAAESYIVAPRVGVIRVGVFKSTESGFTFIGWENLTGGTVDGVDVSHYANP